MQIKMVIVNYRLLIFQADYFFCFFVTVSRQTQANFPLILVNDLDKVTLLEFSDHLGDSDW